MRLSFRSCRRVGTMTSHTGKSRGLRAHAANLGFHLQWEPIEGVNVGVARFVPRLETTWEAVAG